MHGNYTLVPKWHRVNDAIRFCGRSELTLTLLCQLKCKFSNSVYALSGESVLLDAHFIGSNDLVEKTDFAPTILDYAGISVPPDMQGKSLMPLLRGVEREDWRTAIYCHHWQHLLHSQLMAHYGIRTKKHKLIFFYGLPLGLKDYSPTAPEWELFDLMADPREMENMYHRDENSKLRDSLKL